MKNKKILVRGIGLLIIIFLVVTGFLYFRGSNKKEKISYRVFDAITSNDIRVFGEKKQFVAINNGWPAGKRYTISQEGRILDKENGEKVLSHEQRKGEYWNIVIFDLDKDGYPTKKVDLYQAVKTYNSSYFPIRSNYLINYKGMDYLIVTIRPKEEMNSDKDKRVFLNLKSHVVSDIPEDYGKNNSFNNEPNSLDLELYDSTNSTTLARIADENGFLLSESFRSTSPKKQKRISFLKEYPDLKDILSKKGTIYPRYTMVSAEEWFNQMLHWLAPVGESNITVYPVEDRYNKNSTPLTDYPIKSYQDYINWKENQKKE